MKEITREFHRKYGFTALRYWIVTIVCAAAFAMKAGGFTELRLTAIIVIGALTALSASATAVTFITPAVFASRLKETPAFAEINGSKPVDLGARFFYENYIVLFSRCRIRIAGYSEIKSAEIRSMKMMLALENGKKLPLKFVYGDNPAAIAAALRSKNPAISVIINGKVFENKENTEK